MLRVQVPIRLDLLKIESPDTPADRVAEKRRIRKHQVLDIIRRNGPIPRVEIARLLGFNLPSVSSLVDDLLTEGLATEEKAIKTAIGRRPIPVLFNPGAASIVGIDVGKSVIQGLLMNLGGDVIGRLEKPSLILQNFAELPAFLEDFIQELIEGHLAELPPLAGLAIGLPGLIHQSGQAHARQLFPHIQALKDHISKLFGVPVIIDNDARMMAYGVLRFGNASEHDCMAIINLGYGLGMGMVINGMVYQGHQGHSSELGHSPFGQPGVRCHCGLERCLENTASGMGLERMAREVGLTNNGRAATSRDLADMARAGNAKAIEIFKRYADALALGMGAMINLFNPEVVVLAGRVSHAADVFLDHLLSELKKSACPTIHAETQIIVSDLYESAGPMGACACVLHHIFSSAHISVESIV